MLRMGPRRALLYKRRAVGGGAATGVSTDTSIDDAAASTDIDFASQAIGTPTATRLVVVGVGAYMSGGFGTISDVKVGGVSLTRVGGVGDADYPVDMWAGNITTGTTATIRVTCTVAMSNVAIAVAALDNVNPTSTDLCGKVARGGEGTPYTTTTALTVPTDGLGVVACWVFNTSAADFTNLTKDLDTAGSAGRMILGLVTAAGDISPSVSNVNFAGIGLIAAAWAKA